ncbi:MAG TPA: flippase activity-associated protein Agl23, partial [Pyrinomonadaceae bacterium]|nr:flippase activity-associated protein Agl23 [Pyrinomonadaceae bacterium]
MTTHSTKSARKKARARARAVETEHPRLPAEPAPAHDIPDRVWMLGVIVIFVIAAALRFYDLNLVPLHHDEGVNGNFLVRLVREGNYRYDPENYHGPTLYYFSALLPWILKLLFGAAARDEYGLTTFTIRLVTVVFGLGTIGLVFLLRRKLGSVATLAAGLLLAISPGAVYLSRYYIHEMLFVFFTLGIVVAGVWFYQYRNPSYLIPAAASASLLFATKETAFISVGVLLIALVLTVVYTRVFQIATSAHVKGRRGTTQGRWRTLIDDMGGRNTVLWNAIVALFVFVALWVLFYSSFFKNAEGI